MFNVESFTKIYTYYYICKFDMYHTLALTRKSAMLQKYYNLILI